MPFALTRTKLLLVGTTLLLLAVNLSRHAEQLAIGIDLSQAYVGGLLVIFIPMLLLLLSAAFMSLLGKPIADKTRVHIEQIEDSAPALGLLGTYFGLIVGLTSLATYSDAKELFGKIYLLLGEFGFALGSTIAGQSIGLFAKSLLRYMPSTADSSLPDTFISALQNKGIPIQSHIISERLGNTQAVYLLFKNAEALKQFVALKSWLAEQPWLGSLKIKTTSEAYLVKCFLSEYAENEAGNTRLQQIATTSK